jgi:hypothetical protein
VLTDNTSSGVVIRDTDAIDIAIDLRNASKAGHAAIAFKTNILVVLVLREDGRDMIKGSHRGSVREQRTLEGLRREKERGEDAAKNRKKGQKHRSQRDV